MSVVVGTNSWITIVEADAYLTDRLEAEAWFLISDTGAPGEKSKTSLIVTAFHWLYNNVNYDIPLDSSDDNIKNAQAEASFYLSVYYKQMDKRRALIGDGVQQFERSNWSESLGKMDLPIHIKGMLTDYSSAMSIVQLRGEDYLT